MMLTWISWIFLYGPFRIGVGFVIGIFIARLWYKRLAKDFDKRLDDAALELLLRFMDIYLQLDKNFRRHIKGFDGKYLFKTEEGSVAAAFWFKDDDMTVKGDPDKEVDDWDVIVVFKDSKALRASLKGILLKGRLDILDLMLENRVQVYRNMNYVFRFLFMVNDLRRKFPFRVT